MSIFDIDNYIDAAKNAANAVVDAANAISDAGHEIGSVLKTIAPVLSMVPGLGTAFGVAVYAAGALSAADRIDDALIGTASAAMPPGVPRIAFDGGAAITRDIAEGRNVFDSTITSCRKAAQAAGGQKAVAAFDSGLAIAKGGRIDQRLIDEGRTYALNGGGSSAAAAYDAGVSVAKGEGADQALLASARGYIRDQGGPLAVAGFDAGVALGYGKTLQEAGWTSLHTFAKGNDGAEMVVNFVESVAKGKRLSVGFEDMLKSDLGQEVLSMALKQGGDLAQSKLSDLKSLMQSQVGSGGFEVPPAFKPYTDFIAKYPELLSEPAMQLAKDWNLDERLIRAAQCIMRSGDGRPDQDLIARFHRTAALRLELSGKQEISNTDIVYSAGDAPGMMEINTMRAKQGAAICDANPKLRIARDTGVHDSWWKRGFNVAVAVTETSTQPGPGQDAARDALTTDGQYNGFMAAREILYRMNLEKELGDAVGSMANAIGRTAPGNWHINTTVEEKALNDAAIAGRPIATSDPALAAARTLNPSMTYKRAFDVATSVCQGSSSGGSGQDRYRELASGTVGMSTADKVAAAKGFNVAQALQHGMVKSRGLNVPANPGAAAGFLATTGIAGADSSRTVKLEVMQTLGAHPNVIAGANVAIKIHQSFFHRLFAFLHLN